MKFLTFCFFLLVLANINCIGQNMQWITGNVYQRYTNEPIAYASITLKGKPLSSVTNELGLFKFHFPFDNLNDTLHISSLGYKPYIRRVSEIITDSINSFYLDTIAYSIQPVFVLPKEETAEQIVNKAIRRIGKNYPTKKYYLDAFYRELSMRDNKYSRLIEAAVSVQDFGFDTNHETSKIRVDEIRKSNDYLMYGRVSKMIRGLFGNTNLLLTTYKYDYIRTMQSNSLINFLFKDNIKKFVFELMECSYNDDGLVYIIKVRNSSYDSEIKNIKNNFEGKIYIQASSYAIIQIDYGFVASDAYNNPYFFQGRYLTYSSTRYKKYKEKYYPEFINAIRIYPSDAIADNLGTVSGKQYTISTLMINNIFTKRSDFKRINNNEREQPNVDLYEKSFPYNSEFWQNYNILLLDPNLKSIIHDLEEEIPLEDQFKRNGK